MYKYQAFARLEPQGQALACWLQVSFEASTIIHCDPVKVLTACFLETVSTADARPTMNPNLSMQCMALLSYQNSNLASCALSLFVNGAYYNW